MPSTIYLDYAAATPTDPRVLRTMMPYFGAAYGNPSSLAASGRRAAAAIREAKVRVAEVLGVSSATAAEEIIFTGSGTESDNLAIMGAARANRAHGNHIIISAIEHKATLEAAQQLAREGFEISIAPVDHFGVIDLSALRNLLRPETILVSVMYVNNEIGTMQEIGAMSYELRRRRGTHNSFPLLHTDASQAAGFFPLDVNALGVDLMTLNSSKIYGPKGIGMLYKRKGVALAPVIIGGGQENNLRAGTESVPLIVGFAEALASAEVLRIGDVHQPEPERLAALRDYFIAALRVAIPNLVLNGHPTRRSPNNIHISIPHIEGESILLMLDEQGIEVSTGSACTARDLKPSHVLLAIGQSDELAHGSIRFSLGRDTTQAELDRVLAVFPQIVERLTAISALTARVR